MTFTLSKVICSVKLPSFNKTIPSLLLLPGILNLVPYEAHQLSGHHNDPHPSTQGLEIIRDIIMKMGPLHLGLDGTCKCLLSQSRLPEKQASSAQLPAEKSSQLARARHISWSS